MRTGIVVDCTERTYNPLTGMTNGTSCIDCPAHSYSPAGSVSVDDCQCEAGFYNDMDIPGVEPLCLPCRVGMECIGGATLSRLQLDPGYWRRTNSTLDIRRCPDAGENCSSLSECANTTSGCRMSGVEACLPGLTGTFCRLCADSNNSYYVEASGERPASCEECTNTLGRTVSLGTAVMAGLLAIAYLLWKLSRWKRISRWYERASETYALHNKLKV